MDGQNVKIVQKNEMDPKTNEHLGQLKEVFDKQKDKQIEMSNEEILSNVERMLILKKEKKTKKLKITNINDYRKLFVQQFLQLHLNYPSIYNMVLENDDFELNRLKEMLQMRQNIQQNKISNFDASVKISQKYTDEFIKKPFNID